MYLPGLACLIQVACLIEVAAKAGLTVLNKDQYKFIKGSGSKFGQNASSSFASYKILFFSDFDLKSF